MRIVLIPVLGKIRIGKQSLLGFLGFFYFGIMILFGFIYWSLANYSWGDFFIFQQDIHMNTKIKALKRELSLAGNTREFNDCIRRLIRSDEYKRPVARVQNSDKSVSVISLGGKLGDDWAEYYYEILREKGITHISIDKVEKMKILDEYDTYKLQIKLYACRLKDEVYKLSGHKKADARNFKLAGSINIWVLNYPELEQGFLFSNQYYFCPISYSFKNIMRSSISFLDGSHDILQRVVSGRFQYPLWDFMYFSTVTITTLGYGDILPNSTLVRVLVMVESMLGVLIIGAFVSCLFWDKRKRTVLN